MIGRFARLIDGDAHNALLKESHLAPTAPAANALQTQSLQDVECA
jgi:hypothetical protein